MVNHIPAWKRLGLQLKNQKRAAEDAFHEDQSTTGSADEPKSALHSSDPPSGRHVPASNTAAVVPGRKATLSFSDTDSTREQTRLKRKQPDQPDDSSNALKTEPLSKRRKSVTFAADTAYSDQDKLDTQSKAEPLKSTTRAAPDQMRNNARPFGSEANFHKSISNEQQWTKSNQSACLDYLEQYRSARSEWKFNKNKQVSLLKHATDIEKVPSNHSEALSQYIEGLQGERSRERLHEQAVDVLKELAANETEENDLNEINDEKSVRTQWRAEALRDQLKRTKHRLREAQRAKDASSNAAKKRLIRRQRAEEILLALAQSSGPATAPQAPIMKGPVQNGNRHIRFDEDNEQDTELAGASRISTSGQQAPKTRSVARYGLPEDDMSSSESDVRSLPSESTPEVSSSESDSSDTRTSSDESGSHLSGDDSDSEVKPEMRQGPRLNKEVVRELFDKQNGIKKVRGTKEASIAKPTAPKGRKNRPFDGSRLRQY